MNINARLFVAGLHTSYWYERHIESLEQGMAHEPLTSHDLVELENYYVLLANARYIELTELCDKAEIIQFGR